MGGHANRPFGKKDDKEYRFNQGRKKIYAEDELSEEVTVINDLYNEAGQLIEYRREKKPLKEALKEIDNSRIYEWCVCTHDIKEHKGVKNIYKSRAGKCLKCKCLWYRWDGWLRRGPEFKPINT